MLAKTVLLVIATLTALCSRFATAQTVFDIRDFGALSNDESIYAEEVNAQAFMDAIVAANFTEGHNEVVIPANETYHMTAVWANGFSNMTFTIDGTIKLSKNHHRWPIGKNEKIVRDLIAFEDVENITFRGSGTVDGQGYMWWVREYLQLNRHSRPRLLYIHRGVNIEMSGIRWINSPKFHMELKDIDTLHLHDFEIWVDHKGQLELGKLFLGGSSGSQANGPFKHLHLNNMTLPIYALNTDGVDPHGKNILIERLNITNYDDAVAIKPCHKEYTISQCSENIVVRDCIINFGVGMTIGTLVESEKYNCVRNVTFSNHTFNHPFKAVYIKTNPGSTESMLPGSGGIIENILYEDLEIHRPIWWSIYIGPQQQNEPGPSSDPGCLLYPLVHCPTQALIEIRNITLRNVQQHGSILPPGIVRCNSTMPCRDINFENVNADGWWKYFNINYIVENVYGTVTDSSPIPAFLNLGDSSSSESEQPQQQTMLANLQLYVQDRLGEKAKQFLIDKKRMVVENLDLAQSLYRAYQFFFV